jgi:biopolymer transport protein ExbB
MSSFREFVTNEWYFAYPMFAMILAALTLALWRFFLNLNAGTNLDSFLPAFQDVLEKQGVPGAIAFCKEQKGLIPRKLFVAGLETSKQGLSAMRRAMANVIELEILPDLNFLLAPILAIAKIATMVGLLGTVISMINTFTLIRNAGNTSGVAQQAGAIGLALFATALGLATAIPLVFCHVLFKDWVGKFEVKMKSSAQKLLLLVQAARPAAGGPAAAGKPSPAVTS